MPSAFSPARTVLFRLHWALGLTAGLVLALVGLTGALMSYEEAITAFANRDRIQVSAVQDRPPLTPSALAGRIEAQLQGQRVAALTLSGDPVQSAVARFARDRAGGRPSPVYADPTKGTVLGPVRLEGFFGTVRELHRWLLLPGEGKGWGRTITGACAIALLIFLGSGLYLRWPGRHGWRVWLRPHLARPGRARWWSLHAVAGTWLLPVYAVAALSGLWWSYESYRAGATWLLTGQAPKARSAERSPGSKLPDGKSPDGKIPDGTSAIDAAWAEFSATHTPALATLTLPGPEAAAIRIRWHAPDSNLRNEATYDARTGAQLTDKRATDSALGPRIADNMLEVHRGRFFGAPVALVFCLAALALPGFFATGLTLYVLRRRAGRRRVLGRASRPTEAPVRG